jgi:hypothetical protein
VNIYIYISIQLLIKSGLGSECVAKLVYSLWLAGVGKCGYINLLICEVFKVELKSGLVEDKNSFTKLIIH